MSKSTKWMKKGFAWLLCLIMMTGMLSSAAVAADATAPETIATPGEKDIHISFTYESQCFNTGAISWIDEGNKTSVKDLSFSFTAKVTKTKHSTNMGSKYTVEQYWYYKEPGASEYTHISIKNDRGEYDDHYTDQVNVSYNGINASFKHPFKIEDAAEARKGGSYFCRVYFYETTNKNEVKQIGVADTKVITLSVTAKMTFKGAGKFGSDLVVMAQPGQPIPLDKRPIPTTIDNKDFVGWEDSETKEIFYTDSTKVKKGGYFTPVYKANKQAIGLNDTYKLTYNGEVQNVEIVDISGTPVSIPATAYTLEYLRVAVDENGNPVYEPKSMGRYSVTLSLTDEGKDKYELINPSDDGTVGAALQIYQRPITVSWKDEEFVYDGAKHCPEPTVNDICDGDTEVFSVKGEQVNAGESYTAEVEIINNNYCFPENYDGQTKTFSIAKREVKFEWDEKKTFVYDEQSHIPTIKEGSLEGFVEGDDVDYTITINKNESKEVGKYTATFSLTGTSAENYVLVSEATTEFSIVKKQPTVELSNLPENNTVQYGDEFTINYGLKNNSSFQTVTVESSVKKVNGKDVISATVHSDGTITIKALQPIDNIVITVKLGGETNHHYAASESFELKITKRELKLEWDTDTFVYNPNKTQHPEVKKINGLVGKDKVDIDITGGRKDVGEGTAIATIKNGAYSAYYVLDESTASKPFNITKADSSIYASKYQISKTYGAASFKIQDAISIYLFGGTEFSIAIDENDGIAKIINKNEIEILGAGRVYLTLTNLGNDNYESSTCRVLLEVNAKPVSIIWDNEENPVVYTWNGEEFCPTAHVNPTDLINGDKCSVIVSGGEKKAGEYEAIVTGLGNKNYTVNKQYKKKFRINDVVNTRVLNPNGYQKTYYLEANQDKLNKLNFNGMSITVTYKGGTKDKTVWVTESMVKYDPATLGKQNVIVTYDGQEFKFEIQIIKRLRPNWKSQSLTYNGKQQAPEFSVKGLKDGQSWSDIIEITPDENAVDVNGNGKRYTATAVIKKEFYEMYNFVSTSTSYSPTAHHAYAYYSIVPAEVTLSWNTDDAAINPSMDSAFDCDYFDGSAVVAPKASLSGVVEGEDPLVLKITNYDGEDVATTEAVGEYKITAALSSNNYVFAKDTKTSVAYRIINKLDEASVKVQIPQCGQESPYSRGEIGARIAALNGVKMIIADQAYAQFATNEDGVQIADMEPVAEALALNIDWASLAENANSTLTVQGILVPQIEATDVDSFLDAISSLEDDTVKVYGENTYSLILFITSTDSLSAFDADAIKTNLSVADEKGQKTIRYAYATRYGVVALVDVKAVHNYKNEKITDPKEDVAGLKSIECWLDGKKDANHIDETEIPALTVTKIEVLDGYTTGYYVNDAYDNTGLKIKVTLSDESTFEEVVTADMVSGFDSSSAGPKTLTITRKGKTVTFNVTVSKKQSSIDLKDTGEKVTATYGDSPIDLVFDAFNGDVNISSSNENVAKVENGKLVIVGAGETTITLEIKDTNAVVGIKKSFTLEVERKVVGLEWSKDNTFTEDGANHSLTAKATGLVGTDSCDVIVEGGSAEVGTHTVKAIELSNKNYKLPENASTTFVINAKEEPKTEDPKKEEPKTEEPKTEEPKNEEPKTEEPKSEDPKQEDPKADDPKQDAPKKSNIEIKVSTQFKTTYIEGEEIDPTGLTIEFIDVDGNKKVIQVTKDMITGFNSQKVGDSNVTITYEDVTKMIPVTIIEKGDYTFTITTEANGDMHFVVIRKPGNDIAFSLYLGTYVDGKLVPADGIKTWPGSVHGLLFADYLKTLPAGDHKIEVVFKDGKAVATLTIPATTPASDASPVTGDTSSLTMWIILLAAAAAVLVAIRVYAAKRSNAE